jgi:hypothetical protein
LWALVPVSVCAVAVPAVILIWIHCFAEVVECLLVKFRFHGFVIMKSLVPAWPTVVSSFRTYGLMDRIHL